MKKGAERVKHKPHAGRPNLLARLIKLYNGKRMKVSGAKLVARERNRY